MESPQLEELITLATNSFDSWAEQAQNEGVDLDDRIQRLLPLLVKLTDPQFMSTVERLTEKHAMLNELITMGEEAPKMLSTMANTLDSLAQQLQAKDIDIDERLQQLVLAIDVLSNPKVVKLLVFLSHNADRFLKMGQFVVAADARGGLTSLLSHTSAALAETEPRTSPPVSGLFGMLKVMKDKDMSKTLGFGIDLARRIGRRLQS